MQESPNQPPQYPYSQPQYTPPPMTQPPPKKRGVGKFVAIGCGGLLALAIIIGIIIAATSSGSPQANTTATQPAQATQAATQPPAQAPKIGVPVVVNDTWTVTVNKVSTSHGPNEFDVPKSGYIFLVVNVTLKNTSSQAQTVSSLAMLNLKDATGQAYNEDITYAADPGGGTVAPNGLARGDIAYEVPTTLHAFILQFVPDLGGTLVEWNLSI